LLVLAILGLAAGAYADSLNRSLIANEAYSALAAFQPTIKLVTQNAIRFDPGKPVLYHILLHWFCGIFGHSEASIRAMSMLFGVATLALLFALGQEVFGFGIAIVAALLWAFNPQALVIARLGRMYSLFTALALAHVWALSRLRYKQTPDASALAGLAGGAMLYTHLDGVLIIAADCVVIVREFRRDGRSLTLPSVIFSLLLFLPFFPIAVGETRALLFAHWLDWIGAPQQHSATFKLVIAALASAPILWLMLARGQVSDRSESFQRCLIYVCLPVLALITASVIIRPMFQLRYVSPSCAFTALVLAYLLDKWGSRARNLAAAAVTALLFVIFALHTGQPGPWPRIAAQIHTSGSPVEPVVFEFQPSVTYDGGSEFPNGFFRVPFDFYFHGSNPRLAVSGADPAEAAKSITAVVLGSGGVWLISARGLQGATAELPRNDNVRIASVNQYSDVVVAHLLRNR
jgi:uncharacterized membrane protein